MFTSTSRGIPILGRNVEGFAGAAVVRTEREWVVCGGEASLRIEWEIDGLRPVGRVRGVYPP